MALESYLVLSLLINLGLSTINKTNKAIGYVLGCLCALIPLGLMYLSVTPFIIFTVLLVIVTCLNFENIKKNEKVSFEYMAVVVGSIIATTSDSYLTLLSVAGFMLFVQLRSRSRDEKSSGISKPFIFDILIFVILGFFVLMQKNSEDTQMTAALLFLLILSQSMLLSFSRSKPHIFNDIVSNFIQPLIFIKFLYLFKLSTLLVVSSGMIYMVLSVVLLVIVKHTFLRPELSNLKRVFEVNNLIVFTAVMLLSLESQIMFSIFVTINFLMYSMILSRALSLVMKKVVALVVSILPALTLIIVGKPLVYNLTIEHGAEVFVLFSILCTLPLLIYVNLVRGFNEEI